MGFLDSLKNLLGLGKTLDTNKDGNVDAHDPTTSAGDTNDHNDGTDDDTDAEDLPAATPELKGTISGDTDAPKKEQQ